MTGSGLEFWLLSTFAGLAGLGLCRRWSFLSVFVLPISVAVPIALSVSVGAQGERFPNIDTSQIVLACLLVLSLDLVGMKLGGFRFVFFPPYPGRGTPDAKGQSRDRS